MIRDPERILITHKWRSLPRALMMLLIVVVIMPMPDGPATDWDPERGRRRIIHGSMAPISFMFSIDGGVPRFSGVT